MEVIKHKNIKPILKKSEQSRHQSAAQHFIAGAQPFLMEQEIKIRKYVNLDINKDGIVSECKKKFDVMKQSMMMRADEVRQKATSNFDKVLNELLLIGGVAIITLNKLSLQLIQLVKTYGNGAYENFSDELTKVKMESLRLIDQAENSVKNHAKQFGNVLFKYIDIFFNRIEGNVFEEMLMIGAQKAGERANGAMWLILKAFGAFIHTDVRKRPDLEEFLKFGPQVTKEINSFEDEFRSMTHQMINFQGVKARVNVRRAIIETYGEEWEITGYEDVEHIVNIGGNVLETVKRNMYALDEQMLEISKGIASDIRVDSIFSQIKSPSESQSYQSALELINNTTTALNQNNVRTVTAAALIIEQLPEVYTEACRRIEQYLEDNRDRYDDTYLLIQSEYNALTSTNKSDIARFYLIRWILYSVIMDQRKQELYRTTLGSIEQQNYSSDTILNRTLEKMRSINESNENQVDAITSDLRDGRITVEQFISKIDQILDEFDIKTVQNGNETLQIPNYKIFKNLINRNEIYKIFTPHRIVNQINLLKTAIQKAAQVQQGAESSMVHNLNEFGIGGYRASEFDNEGRLYEQNRQTHQDRNDIIPIEEANKRLLEEYIILQHNINEGRRRRKELISQFLTAISELKEIETEIYANK